MTPLLWRLWALSSSKRWFMVKSSHPLVTRLLIILSLDVMWQIRTITDLLPRHLLPTNLAKWWFRVMGSYPLSQMILSSHGQLGNLASKKRCISFSTKRMPIKLSMAELQGKGLPATKLYYHLITRSCGKRKIHIKIRIFILPVSWITILGRVEGYNETKSGQIMQIIP